MAITDLTGYQWTGNNRLEWSAAFYDSPLHIDFYDPRLYYFDRLEFVVPDYPYLQESSTIDGRSLRLYDFYSYSYVPVGLASRYIQTLTFTGGIDATNSALIAWLEQNGTLTKLTPPYELKIDKIYLTAIANTLRAMNGSSKMYSPEEMVKAFYDAT